MNTDNTRNRPPGIMRIHEEVSKLIKPTLAVLYQVFLDQKAALKAERTALLRKQETLHQEGYEAAVRLVISNSNDFQISQRSYFDRIKDNKGDKP